jgi:hypothetical protein
MHQGAEMLRQLDAIQPEGRQEDAEVRLEAAIAARRADTANARKPLGAVSVGTGTTGAVTVGTVMANGHKQVAVAAPDDDLEILLANRRRVRQDKAAGFCPKCGGPVQKSDLFCPKCGTKIVQ